MGKPGKLFILLFLCLSVTVVFSSCGNSSGGGGGPDDINVYGGTGGDEGGTGDNNGGDSDPAFQGFDFTLTQGDFWEFRWDLSNSSWAQGSGGSTARDSGRFRVTLGAPVNIAGVTAYPLQFSGRTGYSSQVDFRPKWNYIGLKDNQILGSINGSTMSVIFDAQNGVWTGGGFFACRGRAFANRYLQCYAFG